MAWIGIILLTFVAPVQGRSDPDPLETALVAYFSAQTEDERNAIARRIAAMPDVTIQTIGERLHTLPLWTPAAPGKSSFRMDMGDGRQRRVWVRVPADYDPARAWPLVISLHGTGGWAEHALDFAVGFLGPRAGEMIVAAPQALSNGPFNIHDESETDQPIRVLRAMRRRFHIDSDRVFLTGYSKGGHRTCSASVMFADQLAGAIPLAGCMSLPQREGLYPQFLPNLRHLPMLLVWGRLDTKGPGGEESPHDGIAGINRRFAEVVTEMQLPVTTVELPGVGHGGVLPPPDELVSLLSAWRERYPSSVSHWFRFPGQGNAYWLRLVEFQGEPWRSGEIHVKIRPQEDPQEAFLRETRLRMGKLEGRVDGQTVTVRAKRVKVVDVLLHDELVDLNQPVSIKLNGRRAFEGLLHRRIETVLEAAAKDWDFDRLFTARVRIAIGRRGKQI